MQRASSIWSGAVLKHNNVPRNWKPRESWQQRACLNWFANAILVYMRNAYTGNAYASQAYTSQARMNQASTSTVRMSLKKAAGATTRT